MSLDRLTPRERQVLLFERYGTLLTEHQREVLELYLLRDWSLAEVARWQRTSRAAVHDLVQRAAESLEGFEKRLGLLAAEGRRQAATEKLRRDLAQMSRRLRTLESALARKAVQP